MTELTEFLFPAPARRSVSGIVRWWESRRLAYNVLVGGAGTRVPRGREPRHLACGRSVAQWPMDRGGRVWRDGERLLSAGAHGRNRSSETLGQKAPTCGTLSLPDGADVFRGPCSISRAAGLDHLGRTDRHRPVLERPDHAEEGLLTLLDRAPRDFRP